MVRVSRNIVQQQRDEFLVIGDIEQRTLARRLPHGGECTRIVTFAVEANPVDPHRAWCSDESRRAACIRKPPAQGRFSPLAGERKAGGQRGRDRAPLNARETSACAPDEPGSTSRSKMARVRCRLIHVDPAGTTSVSNSGTGSCVAAVFSCFSTQLEPVKSVRRQRNQIGQFADRRE